MEVGERHSPVQTESFARNSHRSECLGSFRLLALSSTFSPHSTSFFHLHPLPLHPPSTSHPEYHTMIFQFLPKRTSSLPPQGTRDLTRTRHPRHESLSRSRPSFPPPPPSRPLSNLGPDRPQTGHYIPFFLAGLIVVYGAGRIQDSAAASPFPSPVLFLRLLTHLTTGRKAKAALGT